MEWPSPLVAPPPMKITRSLVRSVRSRGATDWPAREAIDDGCDRKTILTLVRLRGPRVSPAWNAGPVAGVGSRPVPAGRAPQRGTGFHVDQRLDRACARERRRLRAGHPDPEHPLEAGRGSGPASVSRATQAISSTRARVFSTRARTPSSLCRRAAACSPWACRATSIGTAISRP